MKTSLTKRFSIRVKLRGKFVELVITDARNGDIYYEQYDLEAAIGEPILAGNADVAVEEGDAQ